MSWPMVKLGDLFKITSGGTPSRKKSEYYDGGDIHWVKTGDLHNKYVRSASEFITQEGLAGSSARLYPKGTVLVAMYGATIGACSILDIEAATNQACAAFTPTEKVDPVFLYYLLKHSKPAFVKAGSGGAQPNISGTFLKNFEIPLPPLDEQKRIAEILDKADAIRQKRKQAITLADEFLRSVFLEMFGDPVTNPKGFPVGTIRDLVSSANYGTSEKASETEGEYPVLRMGNITYQGSFDFSDLKYIDLTEKELPKYLVHKGDLLFNRTNSKELVGKTAVFEGEEPMAFAGYLIRVRTNENGNNYYLSGYLNSLHGKKVLASMCKSIVGMANINAQELQDIKILLPPIELQNQYEQLVKAVNCRVTNQEDSFYSLNRLFGALSQKAFSGQL
ncbi:restriction endonuclease subunit S [Vibrio cholerae]|uniref:restriction endonuclease subunit S n=1 Tax=Vibrio cholerae TaxID=666 RepID=UPI0011D7E07C|nr:restriction endonuclease subunit S [Vibrio cholerae]EGQ9204904.1 restriction endonuclease [Vibrio cholerae]EGQ9331689.1 restriction endonuclease [Vibrio cholerae]EIA3090216.1 restriction endonuclease subunit S [Vibrio cholerae]EJL6320515.1 restriction endonuclease subunit S [Vibrio cholerae]EJL7022171.1 restriction endonuclease subunit S [Vibrio cholerae]